MIKMLMKFALVGLSGAGVNMLVYIYLTVLGANYLVAAGCSFGVAVTNNFVWNMLWTFKGRAEDKSIKNKYICFAAISTVNLGVNLLVLQLLVKYGQLDETLAQLFAIAVVGSLNFILNYLITFDEKQGKQKKGVPASYENSYYTNLQ